MQRWSKISWSIKKNPGYNSSLTWKLPACFVSCHPGSKLRVQIMMHIQSTQWSSTSQRTFWLISLVNYCGNSRYNNILNDFLQIVTNIFGQVYFSQNWFVLNCLLIKAVIIIRSITPSFYTSMLDFNMLLFYTYLNLFFKHKKVQTCFSNTKKFKHLFKHCKKVHRVAANGWNKNAKTLKS